MNETEKHRQLTALVQTLHRDSADGTLRLRAHVVGEYEKGIIVPPIHSPKSGRARWGLVPSLRVAFTGGKSGPHSIDGHSIARVLAHWEGYVENSGLTWKPKIGDRVAFRSMSSKSFSRTGRVTSVGPQRAVVAYVFGNGRHATKAVPFGELRVLHH